MRRNERFRCGKGYIRDDIYSLSTLYIGRKLLSAPPLRITEI